MSEKKFDSKFHQEYVGGDGSVIEKEVLPSDTNLIRGMTFEEILAEYRWYVRDPKAELPEEVMAHLEITGKIPE